MCLRVFSFTARIYIYGCRAVFQVYSCMSQGFTQGYRKRPRGRPMEHPCYPRGSNAFEVRSPTTLHLQCAESVEGRNPDSIPDTNMEKSLFGANMRANIILPERNHGEHL